MKIGAIFDWDGIIIDSSGFHEKSWDLLAAEEGFQLPPGHFQKSFGMKNEYIIPKILHWSYDQREINRLAHRKEELYRTMLSTESIGTLPGVVSFLEVLRDLQIPCAIGSSTLRMNIQAVLEKLDLGKYFETEVCAEDVAEGKPNPQVFLLAAERIRCDPRNCVVFEDAPAGIAAAHNGGMKAIGIASTRPASMLREADIVVRSFDDLTYTMLKELFYTSNGPAF